jgi:hypothetical protein
MQCSETKQISASLVLLKRPQQQIIKLPCSRLLGLHRVDNVLHQYSLASPILIHSRRQCFLREILRAASASCLPLQVESMGPFLIEMD